MLALLAGEEVVTRESFVSIAWRLVPYWLNQVGAGPYLSLSLAACLASLSLCLHALLRGPDPAMLQKVGIFA